MLITSWTHVPTHDGPVLVGITDFTLDRITDLPGVYRAGRRLAAGWPGLDGALGLRMWALPTARRCGSVSIWRDEAALRAFVGWPPHVAIMRQWRDRGTVVTTSWTAGRRDLPEIWARAHAEIRGARRV
jgi:hypothetical protein